MSQLKTNQKLIGFILRGGGFYTAWFLMYEFWLKPYTSFDKWIITNIVNTTHTLFYMMGDSMVQAAHFYAQIGLKNAGMVWIGDGCDGLSVMAVFVAFIIGYWGRWKQLLPFIVIGVLSVHFINILRVLALTKIMAVNPEWVAFNHKYTFVLIVYAFVFGLWYLWVKMNTTKL